MKLSRCGKWMWADDDDFIFLDPWPAAKNQNEKMLLHREDWSYIRNNSHGS